MGTKNQEPARGVPAVYKSWSNEKGNCKMLVFEVHLWHEIEGGKTRFLNIVGLNRALEFYQEAGYVLLRINPVF